MKFLKIYEEFRFFKPKKIPFDNKGIEFFDIISADRTNSGCQWIIHLKHGDRLTMDVQYEICGVYDNDEDRFKIINFEKNNRRTLQFPELTKNGMKLMKKYLGV